MAALPTDRRDPIPGENARTVRACRHGRTRGQATVEFALASVAFLTIVLGTIDFGRVAFTYSQLHNAVREGARLGKVTCGKSTWVADVKARVIEQSPTLDLSTADIGVTAPGGCNPPTGKVEVRAETTFAAVTQDFLGIPPVTLRARALVDVE